MSTHENPWGHLPQQPDYILPDDEAIIRDLNRGRDVSSDYFLHFDIVPEPFVGSRDAPVLLLSNNPGYGKGVDDRRNTDFAAKMRRNLLHEPAEYPFLFLAPDYPGDWWVRKLNEPIEELGRQVVARSILNVTLFPYASAKYRRWPDSPPSQQYSFGLVKDAIRRKAVIVLMRKGKEKDWVEAVPELDGYQRLYRVGNPRNPTISRRNCSGFEAVIQAIKASEAKRQG